SVPSTEPSKEPSATPHPTPSPTPVPTVGPCSAKELRAKIVDWQGAAGSRIADVTLTNHGSIACTLHEMTPPSLVDGQGTVLLKGTGAPSGSNLTVAPGAALTTEVEAGNYCGDIPVAPITISFDLGGGQHLVAAPQSPDDATLPPCNGPSQPA